MIDVVVPVYNAVSDARRCVESVLDSTREHGGYRLVVIDDASPDPAIGEWMESLALRRLPHLVLLRNERNLGFVGTANRGMKLSRNDVVLLNSDTMVSPRWLEKIERCADSDPSIGTVTPFSNNAEICSFPRFCSDNPWPEDADPRLVDLALESVAAPLYPDLPTGVGFCMYVRRALIDRCGAFDEAFGRGYGEENDLCMRGAAAGFRNVLCDDTFVVHFGSRSFVGEKSELGRINLRLLLERHPTYEQAVHAFIAADPLRPIRELALLRLSALSDPRPGVLHVIHPAEAGGTELHARSLIAAAGDAYRGYLATVDCDRWIIDDGNGDEKLRVELLRDPAVSWTDFIARLAATLRLSLYHVHNVSGARGGLLEAMPASPVPYGYTVHDLHFACPTVTFLADDGRYCGGVTDEQRCRQCLGSQPSFAAIDIAEWRADHRTFVERASFVIAPSRWAASNLERYFPGAPALVVPHAAPAATRDGRAGKRSALGLPADGIATVAVVGAIGPDKGARRLERLVDLTRKLGIPVRWVVIGYVDWTRGPHQADDSVLTIHGRYDRADLPDLLADYRVRLVAYPSACPESFSYTLSEVWAAGYPVMVPPIGALGERVRANGGGWIYDDWTDERAMLEQTSAVLSAARAVEYEAMVQQVRGIAAISIESMRNAAVEAYRRAVPDRGASVPAPTLTAADLREVVDRRASQRCGAQEPATAEPAAGATALPDEREGGHPAHAPQRAHVGRRTPRAIVHPIARVAWRLRATRVGNALVRVAPRRLLATMKSFLT